MTDPIDPTDDAFAVTGVSPARSVDPDSWVRHGVEVWLDRRRIRQHGHQLYWLEPVLDLLIDATEPRNQRYRQCRSLTEDEVEVVGTFNDAELAAFVER